VVPALVLRLPAQPMVSLFLTVFDFKSRRESRHAPTTAACTSSPINCLMACGCPVPMQAVCSSSSAGHLWAQADAMPAARLNPSVLSSMVLR
jgi:hypothetical protein